MRGLWLWASMAVVCAGGASLYAQPQQTPYDLVRRLNGPFMSESDSLAFPLRVLMLSRDRTAYWRGGPDVFYAWAKAGAAADWINDAEAHMVCQGNPHPGSFGAYASDEAFGKLAFGLTDFSDSCRMPFQYELLQCAISLRMVAEDARVRLDDAGSFDKVLSALLEAYKSAVISEKTPTEQLERDPWVGKLMSSEAAYEDWLRRYTADGRFRSGAIAGADGRTSEILRPAGRVSDLVASTLLEAAGASPAFARIFRYREAAQVRDAVRDVALWTRVDGGRGMGGACSGLQKYLVLVRQPVGDVDHDLIFLLQQQVPAAAERAQLVERQAQRPGERAATAARLLCKPQPYINSFANIGANSYRLTLFEPWSSDMGIVGGPGAEARGGIRVRDVDDLLRLARIFGLALGSTHHHGEEERIIESRLNDDLLAKLRDRSAEYVRQLPGDFERFAGDPRAVTDQTAARAAIEAAAN